MSVFTYSSTMLVENVVHTIDRDDVDDDEFKDFCDLCQASLEDHGDLAEFRLTIDGLDSDEQWLFDHLKKDWSGPELMKLLHLAISNDWDDKQMVMALYYARRWVSDADRIHSAVSSEEWCIEYSSTEDKAYVDYAKQKLKDNDEELADGLEDYFDYQQYGRDSADACIQFSDGDFYVFNEWH